MSEFNRNIWAPWRMEYIDQLHEKNSGCFLCHARDNPARDGELYVLLRRGRCLAMLNRFPYTSGHTLIAPYAHVGGLCDLDAETMLEIMQTTRDVQTLLEKVLRAEGFNIGFNVGRCAGAGLPDHIHLHVVPRWSGDTNFMSVLESVRVIPEALDKFYQRLRDALPAQP